MKTMSAAEFDWDCGFPNGFFNPAPINHPSPFSSSKSGFYSSSRNRAGHTYFNPNGREIGNIYYSLTEFFEQKTDGNGGMGSTHSFSEKSTASGLNSDSWSENWYLGVESAPDVVVTGSTSWNYERSTNSFSSRSAKTEAEYTTGTTIANHWPIEWTSVTYTANIYYETTTNASFSYSVETISNSKRTTASSTGSRITETSTSSNGVYTEWVFSASSNFVEVTKSGVILRETREWAYASSYESSSSNTYTETWSEKRRLHSGYSGSESRSASASTSRGTTTSGATTGENFLWTALFPKKSFIPMRATYSFGVEKLETLYYITNSGGNWDSPESLVGPASTTVSYTYKLFNKWGYPVYEADLLALANGVIGAFYGKEVDIQVVPVSDTASNPSTTFAGSTVTGSFSDFITSNKYDIFGQKWIPYFGTSTNTVQVSSTIMALPIFRTSSSSMLYGGVSGDGEGRTSYTDQTSVIEMGGGGKGRTVALSVYSISDILKYERYKWGEHLMQVAYYGVNVLGSAQNGYVSPLVTSFHTMNPKFSAWSKTVTGSSTSSNSKNLSTCLANNFVKIELPELYKSSKSFTFSIMGGGSGAAESSGVWEPYYLPNACMLGIKMHDFSSERIMDFAQNLFNGAHSQREYVFYPGGVNEQELIIKKKGSSGYSTPNTVFKFQYSKGESNITTFTVSSGGVYGAFLKATALSEVLGPDSPKKIVYQAVKRENLNDNKNWQAARWMGYFPAATATEEWFHYVKINRPWGGGGGGGGTSSTSSTSSTQPPTY